MGFAPCGQTMGFVDQPAEGSLLDICSHAEFQGAAGHGAERKNFLDYPSSRHNSIQFTLETYTKTYLSWLLTYTEERRLLGSCSVQKSNPYESVHECKIAPSPSEQLSPDVSRNKTVSPNSHTKQRRSQYILIDSHITMDHSQAHCSCVHVQIPYC
jgi:hypothetical protein